MNYSIYILAGGQSSRMKHDKGLVKIHGQEMIVHCINNITSLDKQITIITHNPSYGQWGHRLIEDQVQHQGPAQGILTALEDSQTDKNLILSCDMPLIKASLIPPLCSSDADITCYKSDYFYPFPGLYNKSILPKWQQLIDGGDLKMQSLITHFHYKNLPIKQADLFLNVNTPSDLKMVEEKLT